ncbi:conserved hypothetical protein [uncultured Pleomorphomonas sp.]|uniref:Uncharacterized protein n=1 Tax=uncultured Pleomorphomonas sp. TaxID=442121 RepID=A0A212LQT3_9HYPH|nr:hypothetical protein [uncultured Pleomorphomonas sp.]SCM79866.1 conserved hypothetical protein [uncultured Pleomorphomonas sp.]
MATKPASRRICKAIPYKGKYLAQFALPGLEPDYVRAGEAAVRFNTENGAEIAALKAFARLYDSRTVDTRKAGGYRRLTGAKLAVLLNDIDITPTYFAEIAGVPQSRVMKWLDGEQDIPHSIHVLARLLAMSTINFEHAERITMECQSET